MLAAATTIRNAHPIAANRKQKQHEYVDETPRRPRRSAHEMAAEGALGHYWVSVIGYDQKVPRFNGDNVGAWPLHVEVNADWRQSGVVYDRQQPLHRAVRLEVIGLGSRRQAAALKAALDEALTGREQESDADPLRHRFRNAAEFGPFDEWWGPLVLDAVMRATNDGRVRFKMFSRADHDAEVAARVRRDMARSGWG